MPKTSTFYMAPSLRRAMTLIEMLVGMAITLVMMAAVVNLFANISTGVNNRQGAMEISADLRIARARLYNDLAGATVRTDDVGEPNGYFEIVEGNYSDENPSILLDGVNNLGAGNPELDYATSLVPSGGDPLTVVPSTSTRAPATGDVTNGGSLGDYDDILAMTVSTPPDRPFIGKGRVVPPGQDPLVATNWVDWTTYSNLAEVIWYAVENPADGSLGEPGMRTIYRRVLLIKPGLESFTRTVGGTDSTGRDPMLDVSALSFSDQLTALRNYQAEYDISARLENGRIVFNTLADLARRENRYAHMPDDLSVPTLNFPHQFPYDVNTLNPVNTPRAGAPASSLQPLAGDRAGGDVVLTNALAFDVQVFDPGAPLFYYQGSIIQPTKSTAFVAAIGAGTPTGFGAYADLGWNDTNDYIYTNFTSELRPHYQEEHRVGWHPSFLNNVRGTPSVYDSWTSYYESDQIDQESVPYYSALTWLGWQTGNVDQGTNGLDDDGVNGPDDPMERETSPPYPTPLKGVQVKLRIYEPDSRAIREANVTRSMAD